MRLRRISLCLIVGGMEAAWLYLATGLLNGAVAGGKLPHTGLMLVFGAAFLANLPLGLLRLKKRYLYPLNAFAALLAALLTLKFFLFLDMAFTDPAWLVSVPKAFASLATAYQTELAVFLSVFPFWLLGSRAAKLTVTFTASVIEFQVGLGVLLFTFIMSSQAGYPLPEAIPLTLCFTGLSFTAIGITHAVSRHGWFEGRERGRWIVLLIISIVVFILTGLALGSFLNQGFLDLLLTPLRWVGSAIGAFMSFLAEHAPSFGPSAFTPPPAPVPEDPEAMPKVLNIYDTVLRYRFLIDLFFVVLILLALYRAMESLFAWMRERLTLAEGVEFEKVKSSFGKDILAVFRLAGRRLRRFCCWLRHHGREDRRASAEPVRLAYRELLHWAAVKGLPREAGETPHEFLDSLCEAVPALADDFGFITDEYVRARYGGIATDGAGLGEIRARWRKIKKARLKNIKTGRVNGQNHSAGDR